MMKIVKISFLLLFTSFFIGCDNKSNSAKDLLPPAIEESSYSSFSKGRQNMVDHVYFNVVDTNASLAQLHKKMKVVEEKYEKWMVAFNEYQQYAEQYAADANRMIQDQQFIDTTVKQKAKAMLANFDEIHKKRTLQLIESMQRLDELNQLLKDKIIVLKLAVTLPSINKYLDSNLPKNMGTQEIIIEYESLLKQVEKEMGAQ
jgi:hypothetical protein